MTNKGASRAFRAAVAARRAANGQDADEVPIETEGNVEVEETDSSEEASATEETDSSEEDEA